MYWYEVGVVSHDVVRRFNIHESEVKYQLDRLYGPGNYMIDRDIMRDQLSIRVSDEGLSHAAHHASISVIDVNGYRIALRHPVSYTSMGYGPYAPITPPAPSKKLLLLI